MAKLALADRLTSIKQKRGTALKRPKIRKKKPAAAGKNTAAAAVQEEKLPLIRQIPFILTQICAAVLLGAGGFLCFVRQFGLEYTRENWHSGDLIGGFIKTWNDIADAFGVSTYTILNHYQDAGDSGGLFLTVLLVLMILIAGLIVLSRNLWFSLLYYLPILILAVVFHLYPGYPGVILLTGGLALLVMLRNLGNRIRLGALVLAAALMAASFALSWFPQAQVLMDRPKAVRDASASLIERIDKARYGTNPLGDAEMTGGHTKARKSSKTALRVTMGEPEPVYLRGYVGEVFTGGAWETLPTRMHYESRGLIAGLIQAGLNPMGQITKASMLGDFSDPEYSTKIKIENVSASRRYAYIPYEILDTEIKGTRSWSGTFLTGTGLRGIREYSCRIPENLTGYWTDVAGSLYSQPYSAEIQNYHVAESQYNVFVYKKYTEVSDEDAELLAQEIGTRGNQEKGHVEYKTAIEKVQTYFRENIIYSNAARPGKNAMKALFENYSGNDEACATAATLMFRYYGIPARYIEGYLVTDEDAMNMESGKAYNIPRSNEHAWTEIYVDGVGWVPIEVCSEYEGVMPEADMTIGLQSADNTNPFYQSEHSSSDVITQKDNEPEAKIPWKKILRIGGLILLILLLALAAWKLLPKAVRAFKRRRAFRQADVKAAISAMYGYALAQKLPIDRDTAELGIEATYSDHKMSEDDRKAMLAGLKDGRAQQREEKIVRIQRAIYQKTGLGRVNRPGQKPRRTRGFSLRKREENPREIARREQAMFGPDAPYND